MHVTRLTRYVLPAICFAFSIPFAYSQTMLQPGIVVQSRIAADQVHSYGVALQEDQYLRLVVDQKGIDLGIRVSDPRGRRIGDFDSPNATAGPETITFIAESSGVFGLEVQPLDELRKPAPGLYEIRIVELRKASDQELRSGRSQLALRSRGVALLNEVLAELPGVNNRLIKTRFEIELAGLMWNFDEKAGAKLLHQAAEVVREILQQGGSANLGSASTPVLLRQRVATVMMKHEPEMALEFVRSTRTPKTPHYFGRRDNELELLIARSLAKSNPRAAFQIVDDQLMDGFPDEILETVAALKEKNPELSAILIQKIMVRLAEQPLIENYANATMASSLVQLVRRTSGPSAGLISDVELRGLLQKMISEVLSYSPPETGVFTLQKVTAESMFSTLRQWGGGTPVINPEIVKSMEQRLAPRVQLRPAGEYVVPQVPFETQEDELNAIHLRAFHTAVADRNFESAFQFLERLPVDERPRLIVDIVERIGPELKKPTSLYILDRARRALPWSSRARDEGELETLLAFVAPYSLLDPNRGFEIVEPLLDQFNDLANAAVTMNGFSDSYFLDGDFDTDGSNALAGMSNQLSKALGQLTPANFQRAKSDADRIRLTTVRIKMHLAIASRAISGSEAEPDVD
jgi:hypothetical protein